MLNREHINGIIQKTLDIAMQSENDSAISAAMELKHQAEQIDLKAVFIGHFSAGKSSLINQLIERDGFLEEDINPTTELATELHLTDGNEYCEAALLDGKTIRIEDHRYVDNSKTAYLKYYICSSQLANLEEFTVVDTPGINSGIEKHNKAIARYLSSESVFLFVTAAENGGLNKYELSFLREICNYSSHIAVIISKCDKLTECDVKAVEDRVREELDLQFIDAPVYCVSRNDNDISNKLVSIISACDAQSIYENKMSELITSYTSLVINSIQAELTGMYLSTYQQEKDISTYTMKRKIAVDEFERKHSEIQEELVIQGIETVMRSISDALEHNIDRMADAVVLGSREGLEACVSESVRPAIISALGEIEEDITLNLIEKLGYTDNFFDLDSQNGERDAFDIIGDAVRKLPIMSKEEPLSVEGYISDIDIELPKNENNDKKNNNNLTYKAATGAIGMISGGTLTWLEVVVVVLPEIIELLKLAFGESKKEKAKKQLRAVIFPQVRERLYPIMNDSIRKKAEQYIFALKSSHEQQLQLIDSKLEESRTLISTNKTAFKRRQDSLENSVRELSLIIEEMEEQ